MMKLRRIFFGAIFVFFVLNVLRIQADDAVEPFTSTPNETEKTFVSGWADFLMNRGAVSSDRYAPEIPFSFTCGDRNSREWVRIDNAQIESGDWIDDSRKQILRWRDDATSLVCEMEFTEYRDFPAMEWVVSLRNEGTVETPWIFDFHSLDLGWNSVDPAREPILYRSRGSRNLPDDFHFFGDRMRRMEANAKKVRIEEGTDGRMSRFDLPFFNYQTDGDGLILALGWNGFWCAEFNNEEGKTRLQMGMSDLESSLLPGESIRLPRVAVLYWQGQMMHGQNMFRQWMLAHHAPQKDGKPVMAPISLSGWGTKEENHLKQIAVVKEKKIPFDAYWIDAAWYSDETGQWWSKLGDWEVGTALYPTGSLRPVSDAAADAGMKFLLWAEPLRVMGCTKTAHNHSDLFLRLKEGPITENETLLVDLTKPEGIDYVTNLIGGMIDKYKMEYYREDFNTNPGDFWKAQNKEGRHGITSAHYSEGFYQFWDRLLAEHPGLVIDNCAGGGGRIELEALSRSIPLWRTDYNCSEYCKAEETQNQSYDLSYWLAGHGTAMTLFDRYGNRNIFSSGTSYPNGFVLQGEEKVELLKSLVEETQRAKEYFYGDYYPLLHGGLTLTTWSAYHYYLPREKRGMFVAIRRPESDIKGMTFDLLTVDPAHDWEFEDVDSGEKWIVSGESIRRDGFQVIIPTPRTARLLFYRQVEK